MNYLPTANNFRALARLKQLRARLQKESDKEAETGSGALAAALGAVVDTLDHRIDLFKELEQMAKPTFRPLRKGERPDL